MVAAGSFCRSDSHLSLEPEPFCGIGRQPICCCLSFLHSWELGLLSEGEGALLMLFLAWLVESSEYAWSQEELLVMESGIWMTLEPVQSIIRNSPFS